MTDRITELRGLIRNHNCPAGPICDILLEQQGELQKLCKQAGHNTINVGDNDYNKEVCINCNI